MIKNKITKKNKLGEVPSAISHTVGVAIGLFSLVVMILKTDDKTFANLMPIVIYNIGFIMLYTFSSLYHFFPFGKVKSIFRKFDHISIYIFIAASYTPICLVLENKILGYGLLIFVWICALAGTIYKGLSITKNAIFSSGLYLGMGWVVVIAMRPLVEQFGLGNLIWFFMGGIFYTLGALIYSFGKKYSKKIELFTHDVFHIFVLGGTLSHFWFIYRYIV